MLILMRISASFKHLYKNRSFLKSGSIVPVLCNNLQTSTMIVLINDIYFLQLSLPAGKVNNFLTNIRKLFDRIQTNVVRVAIASEDFF